MPLSIGEHIPELATLGGGAVVGGAIGSQIYKVTPDRLATYTIEKGKEVPHITDRFIDYAQKVAEKDMMSQIDPHTERAWVRRRLLIIRNQAAKARTNIEGNERWDFQKMYNLGKKYLTQRDQVADVDIGVAQRGANAIIYGRNAEKRTSIIVGCIIGAAIALLTKFGAEKYIDYKETHKKPKTWW